MENNNYNAQAATWQNVAHPGYLSWLCGIAAAA